MRAVILFVVGGIIAGILYVIFYSPWLNVRSVTVSGAELTPQSMIVSAVEADTAGRSLFASFFGPRNILFWLFAEQNPKLVRFPQIRNTETSVSLWQAKVEIRVEERRVESVLCKTENGGCYGLDQDGIIFTKTPEVRGALILKFEDESTSSVVLGNPYFRDPQWFANVEATLDIMKKDGFVPQKVVVNNAPLEEWRAVFPSGLAFYFSLHFVPENLTSILNDVGNRADIKNLQYFDFRVPNRIYYK